MALVIANQRSTVMIVSVKIDKWPAKTVRNPAVLQPKPTQIEYNVIRTRQDHFHQHSPYCQSKAKLKYSPIECKSIDAMNSKYKPIQKSAKARLHMRNFGTVNSDRNENRTTRTQTLPITVNDTTTQTEPRSQLLPITSSQGFNSSGIGKHFTFFMLEENKSQMKINSRRIMKQCVPTFASIHRK